MASHLDEHHLSIPDQPKIRTPSFTILASQSIVFLADCGSSTPFQVHKLTFDVFLVFLANSLTEFVDLRLKPGKIVEEDRIQGS